MLRMYRLVETGAGVFCGGGLACVLTLVDVPALDVPATFTARTVNVYCVLGLSPSTVALVSAGPAVTFTLPGLDSTTYCVHGAPPSERGLPHVTSAPP
jgi:hypothetical protein